MHRPGVSDARSSIPVLGDAGRDEVHHAVGSLHSFVELVDRVTRLRIWRLAILAVLNLLDCLTTWWILHRGGSEANPLIAPVVHHVWVPILIKLVVFAAVAPAVMRSRARNQQADRLLLVAVLYYVTVIAWNLWTLWGL